MPLESLFGLYSRFKSFSFGAGRVSSAKPGAKILGTQVMPSSNWLHFSQWLKGLNGRDRDWRLKICTNKVYWGQKEIWHLQSAPAGRRSPRRRSDESELPIWRKLLSEPRRCWRWWLMITMQPGACDWGGTHTQGGDEVNLGGQVKHWSDSRGREG